MSKLALPTEMSHERAFLVGVEIKDKSNLLPVEDSLRELALLSQTAGLMVVGNTKQRIRRPNPKTYFGSGKIEEIKALVEETLTDVVIFDDELSPRHQRELEPLFGDEVRILDRTALILDIFAMRANTREGRLQVELAQYEYRLPRLTRAWTHLARQAGGGGGRAGSVGGVGLRGPGEQQLEMDRREIERRIAKLRRELEKVRAHRSRHRDRREREEIPTIALVGYTNAGKSTLINRLADANVLVEDKLFCTLDPITRRIKLPGGQEALITDTVGFIQKLPAQLIAAFRATLEEIVEADVLLHVVDITHQNAREQILAVRETLREINIQNQTIVTAFNKIDLFDESERSCLHIDSVERGIPISAMKGEGIPALLAAVENELFSRMKPLQVMIPYGNGRLISLFHEKGIVEETEHLNDAVMISGRIPLRYYAGFKDYRLESAQMEAGQHSEE